jgi:hypothetical protein
MDQEELRKFFNQEFVERRLSEIASEKYDPGELLRKYNKGETLTEKEAYIIKPNDD